MIKKTIRLSIIFLTFPVFCFGVARVDLIKIHGIINPVSKDYIIKNIEKAEQDQIRCLVIEMDTPGGLMNSMKDIVMKMLSANIPIVVYIYPSGSGAVSAGTFITLAAHIAVMAPNTNIGAAHPVTLGLKGDSLDVVMEKATNWAATFMKNIAEKRGKNANWAEKAVRESASITEKEALEQNVIDYVCPDLDSLLAIIDGREVQVDSGKVVLHTKNVEVTYVEMNWRYKLLDKLSDPNIAYILMLLGIYGLIFELSNPGSILPGVVGVIFLILAFFAMQTLPINWAGFLLILFAILLFILEVKVPSYGILTIGGIVSMILGSLMLFDTPVPALKVSLSMIIAAAITTALFFIFAVGMALRAQKRKVTTGQEGIIGEKGIAITPIGPDGDGRVQLHGEIWKARSESPLKRGEKIKVVGVEGLELVVTKMEVK